MINLADDAMTIKLDYELPEYPKFEEGYRRAPRRESHLTEADKALAIKNALRYIHPDHHEQMAKEFARLLISCFLCIFKLISQIRDRIRTGRKFGTYDGFPI